MRKLWAAIEYIYFKILITLKIRKLAIEDAGKDDSNTDFVKLRDSYIFFGPPAREKDRKYYNLLPSRVKKTLPFSSYSIAADIIIRYIRGGLKLGGPKKEAFYHVKKDDSVAEMGAFRGYYCLYLSNRIGPNGKLIAIEPQEDNLFYLRKNIEANALSNVYIVPKGVWKDKDTLTFKRNEDDFQSSSIDLNYNNSEDYKMDVDSLDNILMEHNVNHINFMVIQLNGAELEALEGLKRFAPENIAIAARYKKDGVLASTLIREHLEDKDYTVTIRSRDYIFGSKNTAH